MKKVVVLTLATLVLVLVFAVPAWAATPQDIYDDFVASGSAHTLTGGPYTDEELRAFLNDATIQMYGDQAVLTLLNDLVRGLLEDRPSFPFTGAQVALIAGAGVLLVGLGLALRRKRA